MPSSPPSSLDAEACRCGASATWHASGGNWSEGSERFSGVLAGDIGAVGVVTVVGIVVADEVFFMKGERIGGLSTALGIWLR